MTELEQKIQQANIEKERKHPLLAITNNRKEIREISQATQDYLGELNPDMRRVKIWEAIPRIVIEFISASLNKLRKEDAINSGYSSIVIGDIMELGIDGLITKDGDKDGNLTPHINCRSEFKYENVNLPYMDEVPVDVAKIMREEKCEGLPIQFFENREEIKEISNEARVILADKYGIIMPEDDWFMIPLVVLAFFRQVRKYLVDHKDDDEIGIDIDFAELISIGINKEGGLEEGDPVDYILYISPKQIFKKEKAKDDDKTEK